MMMNLFSVFDPSTSNSLSLNWMSMMIFTLMIPMTFWLIPSRNYMLINLITSFIFKEFKTLLQYSFSNIILFYSMFLFILFNNFMGLFPYIFTASSHLSLSLSLSLSLWISIILYSLINYFNEMMAHLTPSGTPSVLMPFMVIIESISLIIRPFTLAVRLTANMIAGHLLLSLLGSTGQEISFLIILTMMLVSQILLFILEISVSIIQAYVFSILSVLYSSEL
nr:TPA_asm: ATP synthase F0 subunit 6 [Pseudomyrmex gracilis]